MYPYADSFWVQRAQNPLQRVEMAEAETSEEEKGEGGGMERTVTQRAGLIIYKLVCQQPDKGWILAGDCYHAASFRSFT